jgi:NADH-quinone oxidoreductase subunit J
VIQVFAFYLFASLVILSAVLTIFSRNPVHSVLWLIVAFFNAAGLMLLIGAEFIAMLLVIVYVGAVAVLFLFVVMMLNIDFAELRSGFSRYGAFGAVIAVILAAEIVIAEGARSAGPIALSQRVARLLRAHRIQARSERCYTVVIFIFLRLPGWFCSSRLSVRWC